jgi:TonB family protein
VKIEAVLYLFKSTSIPKINFSKAMHGPAPLSGDGIVISPPATIDFDRDELALSGAAYTWNGGQVVPPRFSKMATPTIVALVGQPAMIRIAVPVQFLEKMPDGSLKLREMAGDLPEIPHYLLTFDARSATNGPSGYDLIVSCRMDIATMQGREKIPGIDLDVGRPITARFDKSVEFWSKKGEWFGIMAGQKESGDYTLLILLKVSSADDAPAPAAVPSVVPVNAFTTPLTPPPPPGLEHSKGTITIPVTKPGDNFGRGISNLFNIGDLDQQPVARVRRAPTYPYDMRRAGIKGSVVVEFIISTEGDVIDSRVVKSSRPEFEMPALQAVQQWKFEPGRRRGQVVNVRARQLLEFRLPF